MKTTALIFLGLLILFHTKRVITSLPVTIATGLGIFLLFVLSDLFFEKKPWFLKGIQLYMSVMLFVIAALEMHHIVSSICVLSIIILPRLLNELL
ncbi:hypothetical protein ACFOU2_01295 [Bacillus songklensis]|uniref:Uncharacterized protein n=2 Tax=Bacillus songklensis TaxID=1069116 RepID=A0ABV8AW79_9BACI